MTIGRDAGAPGEDCQVLQGYVTFVAFWPVSRHVWPCYGLGAFLRARVPTERAACPCTRVKKPGDSTVCPRLPHGREGLAPKSRRIRPSLGCGNGSHRASELFPQTRDGSNGRSEVWRGDKRLFTVIQGVKNRRFWHTVEGPKVSE